MGNLLSGPDRVKSQGLLYIGHDSSPYDYVNNAESKRRKSSEKLPRKCKVDLDSSSWYKSVFHSEPSLEQLTKQGWQIRQEFRSAGSKQYDYYYYSPHTLKKVRSLRMAKVFYRIVEHFGCSEDDAYLLFKKNERSFPKQKWEYSCTSKTKLSDRSKVKCLACKEESKTSNRVNPAVKLESDLPLNPRLHRGKRQRDASCHLRDSLHQFNKQNMEECPKKDSDLEVKQGGTAKHWSRGKEVGLENSDIQHGRKKQRLEKKHGKESNGKVNQKDKAKRQPRRVEEDLENSNIHQDRKKHWLEEGVTVTESKETKPSIGEGGRKKIWKIPTFSMIIQSIGLGKQSEGAAKQGDEAKNLSSREEEDLKNSVVQQDHKRQRLEKRRGNESDGEATQRDKTKRWSRREESALTKAYIQYGRNNWEQILSKVPNKTFYQCFYRIKLLISQNKLTRPIRQSKKTWTVDESNRLLEALKILGYKNKMKHRNFNWLQVAMHVKTATPEQCLRKFEFLRNKQKVRRDKKRKTWKEDECCRLVKALGSHGKKRDWNLIAKKVKTRTAVQCHKKFENMKFTNGLTSEDCFQTSQSNMFLKRAKRQKHSL